MNGETMLETDSSQEAIMDASHEQRIGARGLAMLMSALMIFFTLMICRPSHGLFSAD